MQNFSATNGYFSSLISNVNLFVNGTTDSISTTSGSIVSSGGIGIAKTLYANGINAVSITGTSLISGNLLSGSSFTGTSAYFIRMDGFSESQIQFTLSKCLSKNSIGMDGFWKSPTQYTLSKCLSKNSSGTNGFLESPSQYTLSKCLSKNSLLEQMDFEKA